MGNSLSDSLDLLIPFFGNFNSETFREPRFTCTTRTMITSVLPILHLFGDVDLHQSIPAGVIIRNLF